MDSLNLPAVQASIYFLKPNPLYQEEKPYAFCYEISDANAEKSVPQSNMEMERVDGISIRDIRTARERFSVERNGFEVIDIGDVIQYEDFFDESRLQVYFDTLESVLRERLGATKVEAFRHAKNKIRKRHPDFPRSTGKAYEYDQPTSVAHVDTTRDESTLEIRRQHGSESSSELLKKPSQWFNVWKPLKGPLNDWPLTVCDSSTVREETDLEAADLLYTDLATENFQVYHRPAYRWYYISDHRTSEIMVFKQASSLDTSLPGVPHCSFDNPMAQGEDPRESIEVRLLVYYD